MSTKKEKTNYAQYTINTYRDFALSVPLKMTEYLWDFFDCFKKDSLKSSSWQNAKQFTPLYQRRQKIREKWKKEKL